MSEAVNGGKTRQGILTSPELREIAFWIFTGISGFLAYQVWNFAGSIENLTVEVKHLVADQTDFESEIASTRKEIATLRDEITTIRVEQASRTKKVYDMGDIMARLKEIEQKLRN